MTPKISLSGLIQAYQDAENLFLQDQISYDDLLTRQNEIQARLPPSSAIRDALLLYQDDDISSEVVLYRFLTWLEPDSIEPLLEVAEYEIAGYNDGEIERGAAKFQRVLDLDPQNLRAMQGLGTALFSLGKLDHAHALFQTALQIEPFNLYTLRAYFAGLLDHGKDGFPLFLSTLTSLPSLRDRTQLLDALTPSLTPSEISKALSSLRADDPRSSEIERIHAHLLQRLGDLQGAEAAFIRACQLDPGNLNALRPLCSIHLYHTPKRLLPLLTRTLVHLQTPEAVRELLLFIEDPDLLPLIWKKLLSLAPSDFLLRTEYITSLYRRGQRKDAKAALQEALRTLPQTPQISSFALSLASRVFLDLAEIAALYSFRLFPDHPDSLFALGWIFLLQNKLDRADFHGQNGLQTHPSSPDFPWLLSQVAFRRRLFKDAEALLRTTLSLDPAHLDAQLSLAECLLSLGRFSEAEPLFRHLLDSPRLQNDAKIGLRTLLSKQGKPFTPDLYDDDFPPPDEDSHPPDGDRFPDASLDDPPPLDHPQRAPDQQKRSNQKKIKKKSN